MLGEQAAESKARPRETVSRLCFVAEKKHSTSHSWVIIAGQVFY